MSLGRSERTKQPLVTLILDWYHPEIHAGVVRAARDFGWNLDDDRCSGHHGKFLPQDWVPDGILTTTATDVVSDWVKKQSSPVVRLLDDSAPKTMGLPPDSIPTVVPRLRDAGVMAARHLLSLGVRHIAYYRFYQPRNDNAVFPAFMETCRNAGVEPVILDFPKGNEGLPHSQWPAKPRRLEWLKRKLAELPLPCALMTDDDRFAIEAMMEARELGLRVPEDLAILGVLDSKLVHQRVPTTLSSIDVNLELLGYEGGCLLERMMRGEAPAKTVYVPARNLIERKSTSTYVCDDPRISKTVLRIRRDFSEPLTLPLLAREAGMSVRALQRAYAAVGGGTIREMLMERRLNAAASLLRDTDLKLESVACETGLGNATNLCRLFRKRFGTTPVGFRQGT
ncbi:MAG: substrate-binding domain-containing protein [Luteolibacter sp.]